MGSGEKGGGLTFAVWVGGKRDAAYRSSRMALIEVPRKPEVLDNGAAAVGSRMRRERDGAGALFEARGVGGFYVGAVQEGGNGGGGKGGYHSKGGKWGGGGKRSGEEDGGYGGEELHGDGWRW